MSNLLLDTAFEKARNSGRKAFIPYVMAGDGGLESLEKKLLFLQEAGVTAIEIGIPFSDPVADGPTIQEASKRALDQGTSLTMVLDYVKGIQQKLEVPLILMTYLNPIYQYGVEKFASDAKAAGISGVIVPDLPLEQSQLLSSHLKNNSISFVQLISLTSPEDRIKKIAAASEGFLYAVTVNGITGARSTIGDELQGYFKRIKQYSHTPVLAGFGISTPEHVQTIDELCDGVIVGSKIISLLEEDKYDAIKKLVQASVYNPS
jgi:tryptophan synthase alpha chain